MGNEVAQTLLQDQKFKKNHWKVAFHGCFRILRYPGNPTFPEAAETRFLFFGKKLMRVELYFPIVDEKNAVRTEINFYKKYLPGCDEDKISILLQYRQKINHPMISNDRVHLRGEVFHFFCDKMKNETDTATNSYSYFSDFITEEDFQDPIGTFLRHRTFGRGCICAKKGVEVKKYLQLTLSHPDYDFVKNLLTDSLSGIKF